MTRTEPRLPLHPKPRADSYFRQSIATPTVIKGLAIFLVLGKLLSDAGMANLGATEAVIWLGGYSDEEAEQLKKTYWLLTVGLIASIATFDVGWGSRLRPIEEKIKAALEEWQFKDIFARQKVKEALEKVRPYQNMFAYGLLMLLAGIAILGSMPNIALSNYLGGVDVEEDIGAELIYNSIAPAFGIPPIDIPPEGQPRPDVIASSSYYFAFSGFMVFLLWQCSSIKANAEEKSFLLTGYIESGRKFYREHTWPQIMTHVSDSILMTLFGVGETIVGPFLLLYWLCWSLPMKAKTEGFAASNLEFRQALDKEAARHKAAVIVVLAHLFNTVTGGMFYMKHALETWGPTAALKMDRDTLFNTAAASQTGNFIATFLGRSTDIYNWVFYFRRLPQQQLDINGRLVPQVANINRLFPTLSAGNLRGSKRATWYYHVGTAFVCLAFELLIGIKSTNSFLEKLGVNGRTYIKDSDIFNLCFWLLGMAFLLMVRLISTLTFTVLVALEKQKKALEGDNELDLNDEDEASRELVMRVEASLAAYKAANPEQVLALEHRDGQAELGERTPLVRAAGDGVGLRVSSRDPSPSRAGEHRFALHYVKPRQQIQEADYEEVSLGHVPQYN